MEIYKYLKYVLRGKASQGDFIFEQKNTGLLFNREKYEAIISDNNILELYDMISDGFKIQWYTDDSRAIGGQMEFPEMKHVLGSWQGILFEEEDLQRNPHLKYYKALDLISEQHTVGFLHGADFEANSLYCHISPYSDLYSLDLDFEGYMQMAFEAKIYYYWPKVLLDIQSNLESKETQDFKENMPKLFEDFSWDDFVKKYESLRLSKQ